MRILVTGSAGHLGEALVRTLREGPHEAVGIDVKPSAFTQHVGTIADRAFVRRCMTGVDAVLHAATLHKPHVGTHGKADFITTNVTGTLHLLEEAVAHGVGAFVFTSTTSTFGDAMKPVPGAPAAWVDEDLRPVPKNIYGASKLAAEDLCALAHREHGLPCIVLRTSRFFAEEDDEAAQREAWSDANLKANEFLHRRVDIQDAADAHLCALKRASAIGFGRYIVTATTPFQRDDVSSLRAEARQVVSRRLPGWDQVYERVGWKMAEGIDRVYVNDRARRELGWQPRYDFAHLLEQLARGEPAGSPMARLIGAKGYHDRSFDDGPYPV